MTDVVVSQLIDDNSKPSKVQHLYSTVLTHYFPPPSMARSDTVTLDLLPLPLFLFRYWTSDTSRALSGCSPSNVDVPQALSTAFFDIMLIVGNWYSHAPIRLCCGVII
ncbi:hypothetical protein GYMLUDRAFT_414943 [Collybiopsis luxurians FD-317 M1]|nr:hypothetical protein GYMLUDRAFT_414943 [Collybiopsis luxurians FD-317 M1]